MRIVLALLTCSLFALASGCNRESSTSGAGGAPMLRDSVGSAMANESGPPTSVPSDANETPSAPAMTRDNSGTGGGQTDSSTTPAEPGALGGQSTQSVEDGTMDAPELPAGGTATGEPLGGSMATPPTTTIFSNAPQPCEMGSVVGPTLPLELGHRAAAILTPPSYPFSVTEVHYDLINRPADRCTNALAHVVEVYTIGGDGPPVAIPSANGGQYLNMPVRSNTDSEAKRRIRLVLERPVQLSNNERLVVSVQLTGANSDRLCIGMCDDQESSLGQEWWSNAAEEPYSWQDMNADFSIVGQFVISAGGSSPE